MAGSTDCRARVAFVSQPLLDTINAAAATVPFLTHLVPAPPGAEGWKQLESLLFAHAPAAVADTCADEVAYWQYSSGSTGQPKGVMHVESTPHFVAELCVRGRLGITESDVLFSTAKAFFAFGLNNSLVSGLAVGAAAILAEDHPTPANIASVVRSHRPTVMFAVPTTYAAMLADPSFPPDGGLERLRLCISAGEPLPPAIGRAWRDRFGVDIVNVVGSTEVGHFMLSHRPGAVDYEHSGIAVDGFDLQLTDDSGTPVATGEIGELHVRGPTIALGYWNNQERTRNTFIGEWLRTGDKYRRNADGSFVYVGRADDLFKVSGNWLSPAEVEAALMLHPNVVEAAVVPYVNADGLVKPKAFVVLRDAKPEGWGRALREELQVHVKHTIGVWKYPRWIEFIERLPRTATGKLQRYKLRGSSGTV